MALKAISKKIIREKSIEEQLIREIKIQFYLRHPGVVELYGMFHDKENVYLLMELGCDGQLFDLIETKKVLKEETVSFLAKNLLEVAEYMHGKHVLHRDLKPENIVLVLVLIVLYRGIPRSVTSGGRSTPALITKTRCAIPSAEHHSTSRRSS